MSQEEAKDLIEHLSLAEKLLLIELLEALEQKQQPSPSRQK